MCWGRGSPAHPVERRLARGQIPPFSLEFLGLASVVPFIITKVWVLPKETSVPLLEALPTPSLREPKTPPTGGRENRMKDCTEAADGQTLLVPGLAFEAGREVCGLRVSGCPWARPPSYPASPPLDVLSPRRVALSPRRD